MHKRTDDGNLFKFLPVLHKPKVFATLQTIQPRTGKRKFYLSLQAMGTHNGSQDDKAVSGRFGF
jgi:hypothetical protein